MLVGCWLVVDVVVVFLFAHGRIQQGIFAKQAPTTTVKVGRTHVYTYTRVPVAEENIYHTCVPTHGCTCWRNVLSPTSTHVPE